MFDYVVFHTPESGRLLQQPNLANFVQWQCVAMRARTVPPIWRLRPSGHQRLKIHVLRVVVDALEHAFVMTLALRWTGWSGDDLDAFSEVGADLC